MIYSKTEENNLYIKFALNTTDLNKYIALAFSKDKIMDDSIAFVSY